MRLAICIPTYNRREYLQECILSITKDIDKFNLKSDIEICISDNNSTDGTDKMVEKYAETGDYAIVYHKNSQNLGADNNYLKCVEIANADYCWLMGSDDTIISGSLSDILKEIDNYKANVYLANRILCDINMKPIRVQSFYASYEKEFYNTGNKDELKQYFDNSDSLGCVFSYLSSIIVNTKKWRSVVYDDSYTGTAYSHVFIILSFLLQSDSTLRIRKQPLVYCRMGNDSFLDAGALKRFMIDIDGYSKLAGNLFGNDETLKNSFLNILTREHKFVGLLKLKMTVTKEEWSNISDRLTTTNFDHNLLNKLNKVPLFVFPFIRTIIKIKKWIGN